MEIAVIVVFYKPEETYIKQFEKLGLRYLIIVVDNTPVHLIDYPTPVNVTYIRLSQNKGIAAAQNIGVDKAKEAGVSNVLFFDQDSLLNEEYIDNMLTMFLRYRKNFPQLAALGPSLVNQETKESYKQFKVDGHYSEVPCLISSGSIVDMNSFYEIGPYEEGLFIDLVDFEWCWRAANKGYKIALTKDVCLYHQVGKRVIHIMGLPFIESAPFRYYYFFRNSIWMYKRKYVPFAWKIKSFTRLIMTILFFPVICSQGKIKGLQNICRGIRDGIVKL